MTESKRILVVEDNDYYRNYLRRLFEDEGCTVTAFGSAEEAIASFDEVEYSAAVLDWQLGAGGSGTDVLRAIARLSPAPPVIMISSYVNLPEIASAYKIGIVNYLKKPVNPEELLSLFRKSLQTGSGPPSQNETMVDDAWLDAEELIGDSQIMCNVRRTLRKFGPTDAMILLEGESGTGKEVAARALHRMRNAKPAPFEAVNCGAIAAGLSESELFGHVKGAFTGAQAVHRGVFDRAAGGTVFLDEIGELPLDMQPKLLRVLDTREYRAVGGEVLKRFLGKVIFATNRNLRVEAAEGRFRQDLYARISEVVIALPALRHRGAGDIDLLIDHFLAAKDPERRKQFSDMALGILKTYSFATGNVRQLQRYVNRAFFNSEGNVIDADDLPLDEMTEVQEKEIAGVSKNIDDVLNLPFKEAKACLVADFERLYIEHHFRISGFHIGRTAKAVELSERQLGQKLIDYGLHKPATDSKSQHKVKPS